MPKAKADDKALATFANTTSLTSPTDDAAYLEQLRAGLAEHRTVVPDFGGGKPILKMPEGGIWLFGQDDAAVEVGSQWCINVRTIQWGFTLWIEQEGKNKKHSAMGPMTQPRPARPAPIAGKDFKESYSFDLLCVSGEDAGTEVTYSANTVGIAKAFPKLRDAIFEQLARDQAYPCPIVTLSSEGYRNNYGQQYNPVFTIVGWADLGGTPKPKEATAAVPGPARRRAAPQAGNGAPAPETAPEPAPEPLAPVSTTQAHTGQRRRHRPAA